MPRIGKKEPKFEESPLLSKENRSSSLHSTIHPERFDMTRFSERQEENGNENSFRIIIYIIVVIVVGVSLALLVRSLIARNSNNTDQNQNETEEPANPNVVINIEPKPDTSSANTPTNEDFIDTAESRVGSDSVSAEGVEIDQYTYDKYTTFSRNTFTMTGLTSTITLPEFFVEFDSAQNQLRLQLPDEMTVHENLQETISVNDFVTSVVYSQTDNSFTINLSESFKYRITTTISSLILDVKSVAEIEKPEENESEEETESPEPVEEEPTTEQPTGGQSGSQNLTNEFSMDSQTINNSAVTGNTIEQNVFYYADTVDYFEFAWARENAKGDNYIPNASAKIVEENNKVFIEVTVKNLKQEAFESFDISGTALTQANINLDNANFKRVDRISLENGTAVYRFELKNKAQFRLTSDTTLDGRTTILSLQIKDR